MSILAQLEAQTIQDTNSAVAGGTASRSGFNDKDSALASLTGRSGVVGGGKSSGMIAIKKIG